MWPQKRQQDSFLTLTHVICNFRDFLSCWIHFCNLGFRSQKWTPWPPLQHVIWRPQVSLFTQLESIALYSFQEVGVTLLASGGLLIDVRNGFNTYKNTYRMAVFILRPIMPLLAATMIHLWEGGQVGHPTTNPPLLAAPTQVSPYEIVYKYSIDFWSTFDNIT